jgi:CrcB protein
MNTYLIVFFGSGIGGALRHGVNIVVPRLFGTGFPYHTLTVNIVGSFAMGLLAGYFAIKADPGQSWRLFLTTGIIGGFTTFSAFSLDVAVLYERGAIAMTAIYVLASVGISVAALFAGMFLMRTL